MKEEENDILKETIKSRKKLPKEIKDDIMKTILVNCIFASVMAIITFLVNFIFFKFTLSKFEIISKVIGLLLAISSIIIFEISYRKDSFKIALYGIEFVIFSIIVLYVPYMYILNNEINFLLCAILIYGVYYIGKSIFYLIHTRNKYLKENISDVKEIVKDEKKGYLDETSKKKYKNKK